MHGLCVDLPYPSTKDLHSDLTAARIIAPAYASMHGELTALLSYTYSTFYMQRAGLKEYAETLTRIAVCEMEHFHLLGETLLLLGVDPVYTAFPPKLYSFYSTSALNYRKHPRQMLLDAIAGEMQAIEDYKRMQKRLANESVCALIARITLDEQLHLSTLNELYAALPEQGL